MIAKGVAYGLALALLYLLLAPSGQLQLSHLLQPAEMEPVAVSYARAVRAAAPAVVNVYTRSTQLDERSSSWVLRV